MTLHNFSAGPGALPQEVLVSAQQAIACVPEVGLSVLGISHRSAWFKRVVEEAADNIRTLLRLPRDYEVLFLQGGASLQFTMVPLALLRGRSAPAEYVVSGYWSAKAVSEAEREGCVRTVWNGAAERFNRLPEDAELEWDPGAAYIHYVSNETVEGLQFQRVLGLEGVPRVCDMSADFLSRPIDAARFALIYAHAQKNLGPAGVTVVLVHQDVLRQAPIDLPAMLDYRTHAAAGSIYNTPPVFAIYVTMLVTRWLQAEGGLCAMAARNEAKARLVYDVIDAAPEFYRGSACPADRSRMNATFTLATRELERRFITEAERAGLHGLEGHRSRGGVRASLYNAVSLESVQLLRDFMLEFHAGECRSHPPFGG
jgi:phosphoserine aminotransferase